MANIWKDIVLSTFLSMMASEPAMSYGPPPGQGKFEYEAERQREERMSEITPRDQYCAGVHKLLYEKGYDCITRFQPQGKEGETYSASYCANIDIGMKACGIPIPKTLKADSPGERRERAKADARKQEEIAETDRQVAKSKALSDQMAAKRAARAAQEQARQQQQTSKPHGLPQ